MFSLIIATIAGAVLALALAHWAFVPVSRHMQRGYFNAFVTGLLLAAAIEVLPNALDAVELAARYVLAATGADGATRSGGFWAFLIQPAQLQLAIRSFGAAIVMLIFFRANGTQIVDDIETQPESRAWRFALPTTQTDYLGLIVLLLGLAGYTIWMGLSRRLAPAAGQMLSFELLLLVFISSLLGVAVVGLIANFDRRWWLLPLASLFLALAASLGAVDRGEWLALEVGLVPLVVSAFCLVFGIGRLLRLLQHEIGLGWQTTLTVAIGALFLYQSRFLL